VSAPSDYACRIRSGSLLSAHKLQIYLRQGEEPPKACTRPVSCKRLLAQKPYAASIAGIANGSLRRMGGKMFQYGSCSQTAKKAGTPTCRDGTHSTREKNLQPQHGSAHDKYSNKNRIPLPSMSSGHVPNFVIVQVLNY